MRALPCLTTPASPRPPAPLRALPSWISQVWLRSLTTGNILCSSWVRFTGCRLRPKGHWRQKARVYKWSTNSYFSSLTETCCISNHECWISILYLKITVEMPMGILKNIRQQEGYVMKSECLFTQTYIHHCSLEMNSFFFKSKNSVKSLESKNKLLRE